MTDEERRRRLESNDPAVRVEGYVQRAKARSALYLKVGEAHPLPMIEALRAWAEASHCTPWLARLDAIEDAVIEQLIDRVPPSEMTGPAAAFARAMLRVNKGRILGVR